MYVAIQKAKLWIILMLIYLASTYNRSLHSAEKYANTFQNSITYTNKLAYSANFIF